MDIIFNIIENTEPDSMILLTISFIKKYNISIGKNNNMISIYCLSIAKMKMIKYNVSLDEKYIYDRLKHFIIEKIDNTSISKITGISDVINKKYLQKYFLTSVDNLNNNILNIFKGFD